MVLNLSRTRNRNLCQSSQAQLECVLNLHLICAKKVPIGRFFILWSQIAPLEGVSNLMLLKTIDTNKVP
jgi:hypothetical protein